MPSKKERGDLGALMAAIRGPRLEGSFMDGTALQTEAEAQKVTLDDVAKWVKVVVNRNLCIVTFELDIVPLKPGDADKAQKLKLFLLDQFSSDVQEAVKAKALEQDRQQTLKRLIKSKE